MSMLLRPTLSMEQADLEIHAAAQRVLGLMRQASADELAWLRLRPSLEEAERSFLACAMRFGLAVYRADLEARDGYTSENGDSPEDVRTAETAERDGRHPTGFSSGSPSAQTGNPTRPDLECSSGVTEPIAEDPEAAPRLPVEKTSRGDESTTDKVLPSFPVSSGNAVEPVLAPTDAQSATHQASLKGKQLSDAIDLLRVRIQGTTSARSAEARDEKSERGVLEGIVRSLEFKHAGGSPQDRARRELKLISAEVHGSLPAQLRFVTTESQHAVVSWLTARARSAQEALILADSGFEADMLMPAIAASLRALGEGLRCGFVHGLARLHGPEEGTWSEDAEKWLHRLRGTPRVQTQPPPETCVSVVDDLYRSAFVALRDNAQEDEVLGYVTRLLASGETVQSKRLVNLAGRCARLLNEAESAELRELSQAVLRSRNVKRNAPVERDHIPADWRLRETLRGTKLLIAGGESRPERVEALKANFGFASVEWPAGLADGPRAVEALKARMRDGGLDYVIVLQTLCSHSLSDAVFDAAKGTSCRAVLAQTYGLLGVRLAFERYLGAR